MFWFYECQSFLMEESGHFIPDRTLAIHGCVSRVRFKDNFRLILCFGFHFALKPFNIGHIALQVYIISF